MKPAPGSVIRDRTPLIAATGSPVAVTGISIYRFEGRKVAEEWTEFDGIGMLAQMGALPE